MGSYVGLPWIFIKPLAVVGVMWLAFTYGLKVGKIDNQVPFAMWLIMGMIPWFFVSESILSAVQSLSEYGFLIKNISFRPGFIPLIKIFTNAIIHLFFIVFLMVVAVAYGYSFTLHWFQVFYYMLCALVLTAGISWFISAIQPFIKDAGHVVEVMIQLLFWGTPIIWSSRMLPDKYVFLLKLNPFCYIVEGYRDTFIFKVWAFEHVVSSLCFWGISLGIFLTGAYVFRKLKPHFADVL